MLAPRAPQPHGVWTLERGPGMRQPDRGPTWPEAAGTEARLSSRKLGTLPVEGGSGGPRRARRPVPGYSRPRVVLETSSTPWSADRFAGRLQAGSSRTLVADRAPDPEWPVCVALGGLPWSATPMYGGPHRPHAPDPARWRRRHRAQRAVFQAPSPAPGGLLRAGFQYTCLEY